DCSVIVGPLGIHNEKQVAEIGGKIRCAQQVLDKRPTLDDKIFLPFFWAVCSGGSFCVLKFAGFWISVQFSVEEDEVAFTRVTHAWCWLK
ncbi:hypothetical protein U1Q18_044354, partial [Sarracenia purpurea var. burkii]